MNARKVVPFAVAAVVLAAGLLALSRSDHPAAPESTQEPMAATAAGTAPRSQPGPSMVEGTPASARPLASSAVMGTENGETPSMTWTVPTAWEEVRSPNNMRVATYRVRGAASEDGALDISVARAGGLVEANIMRWQGQFEVDPTVRRNDTTIQGLAVTLVDIKGTYRGGGMVPGVPPNPHPGWTMLAAIVAPPTGAAYFFKVLGPSAAVDRTRASFGALVQSFKPAS